MNTVVLHEYPSHVRVAQGLHRNRYVERLNQKFTPTHLGSASTQTSEIFWFLLYLKKISVPYNCWFQLSLKLMSYFSSRYTSMLYPSVSTGQWFRLGLLLVWFHHLNFSVQMLMYVSQGELDVTQLKREEILVWCLIRLGKLSGLFEKNGNLSPKFDRYLMKHFLSFLLFQQIVFCLACWKFGLFWLKST